MRYLIRVMVLVLTAGVAGCGPGVGRVTGRITLKGEPVVWADLRFESASTPAGEFFGLITDDGTYAVSYRELKGLPIGSYRVTVTRYTQPDGKPLPAGEAGRVAKSSGKVGKTAYQFEKEIVAGTNAIDLELSDGKAVRPE